MSSTRVAWIMMSLLFGAALPLAAQEPLPPPPAGFKEVPLEPSAQALKDTGQGDMIAAEKESDSGCVAGSRTAFRYGWQVPLVGFDKTWEVWKNAPEEPASSASGMGISDEPSGKRPYKGGILEWRKVTRAVALCANRGVTYKGTWMSYVSGRLVTLIVENVDSKATGQSWIDGYLDRVVDAARSAPVRPRTPAFVEPYIPTGFAVDDETTVTQYLGAYNITRVSARRANQLPKPYASPEESDLDLLYTEIVDPTFASVMWQEAQKEAEQDSQGDGDSGRTFIGKETTTSGGTIYWFKEDPLRHLPRRLRTHAGSNIASLSIYDATITQKLDKGFVTVKITDFVGEREALRRSFTR